MYVVSTVVLVMVVADELPWPERTVVVVTVKVVGTTEVTKEVSVWVEVKVTVWSVDACPEPEPPGAK